MAEFSLDNMKVGIEMMLLYMEDRPEEFDVSQVNYYKERLGKCNDFQYGEELLFYVSALFHDWDID